MPKRMTDSELWNKDWFLNLNLKQKLLVKYIFDNCDCAGVYEISYRHLKNIFDTEITKEDFLKIKQVKFIGENKIFVEDFIAFQYGIKISDLNEKYSVHKGIIKKLNKINYFETLNQPLANPSLEELQDKDKDKDKNKVNIHLSIKEKEKNKKEKEISAQKTYVLNPNPLCASPDLMFNKDVNRVFELYRTNCNNLTALNFEVRDLSFRKEIQSFLGVIDNDFLYLEEVFKKANKLKFIVDKKIDLKALLKNHIRIYSDFYLSENKNQILGSKNDKKADNDFDRQILEQMKKIEAEHQNE